MLKSLSRPYWAAVLSVVACCAAATQATVITASSAGYGLDAHLQGLNAVNLDAGPLPAGISGNAPAVYNASNTVLNVNVTSSVPVVASGLIGANSVSATASSNVNGLSGSRTTSGTSSVVGANVNMTTLPAIGPGLTLVGLNATANSSATITGDHGSLSAVGSATFSSLGLTISGIPVNLSAYVGVPIAPNTSVNLAALGIANASLILNQQLIAPGQDSISVNALNLSLNVANSITGNVILGHSQASVTTTAVPEPASLGLLAGGATMLLRRRRRPS